MFSTILPIVRDPYRVLQVIPTKTFFSQKIIASSLIFTGFISKSYMFCIYILFMTLFDEIAANLHNGLNAVAEALAGGHHGVP